MGFAEQLSCALYRLDRKEYGTGVPGDAFLYTRAAVVAAGRAEYETVLNDPALFGPYAEDFIWAEPLLYVPDNAYQSLTLPLPKTSSALIRQHVGTHGGGRRVGRVVVCR
ncbi:DUF4240 domain-containing protein, partial [Kitasatospora sp. NPDC101235]|uniref:DUF4240 domain-containing protein n=1 Tax=Kitasatospora sp. NPDC101235 TaxID=3364101 RepID=UPI0038164BFE